MVCVDQMCSPPSGCCNWRILGASSLFRWSQGCNIGRMSPSSSCLHHLLSLHSTHPALQGCLSLAPGLWLLAADHRSLQCHHHHSQLLLHKLVMLNGDAFRRMVMSRLETGRHPMMAFTVSLWMRNPTPCSCLSSRPLKNSLWPSGVDVSPKFFPAYFKESKDVPLVSLHFVC